MIRKQCGFWIPVLSVIAVLLMFFPGFTAQATTYTYLELGFSEEPEIGKKIPFTVVVKSSKPDDQIGGFADVTWFDMTEGSRVLKESDRFQKDHTYQVEIKYKCNAASDISKDAVFWINGNAAGWNKWRSMWAIEYETYRDVVVYCNISMSAQVIASVRLPDLPQVTAGKHPPYLQNGTYRDENNHCHINYGRTDLNSYYRGAEAWFDETDRIWLDEFDTFQANHTYRYYVAVSADSGYVFDSEDCIILKVLARTLSGQEKYAHEIIKADGRGVTDFAAGFLIPCKSVVSSVSVTGITVPDASTYPDYSVTAAAEEYYIWHYTGNGWKDGVYWRDLTADTLMTESSRFQAGHTYRCSVLVSRINADYEFANDGTKPTVNAFIDGKQATASKSGGNDIGSTLVLYRDYTIPAEQTDIEIDRVEVLDVTGPVYGAKPSYTAAAPSGADYSVWTSYETENRKNGVLWYDKTDKRYMSAGDTFALGHVYEVSVYLIPDRGYVFATRDDGRFDVAATLNGDWAEAVDTGDDTEIEITYSFACVNAPVSSVSVSFEEPAAGREPDWSMKAYGEGYRIEDDYTGDMYFNGVYWRDDTEEHFMKPGDVFVTGHTYTVTVSLVTEEGYEFADYQNYGLTAYLNGVHADSITAWHEPEINIGLVKTYTLSSDRLPGDANADGKVDMLDALRVVQYQEMVVPINMVNADVTGDGKVTVEDARLIGQWAAGWNVGLK